MIMMMSTVMNTNGQHDGKIEDDNDGQLYVKGHKQRHCYQAALMEYCNGHHEET